MQNHLSDLSESITKELRDIIDMMNDPCQVDCQHGIRPEESLYEAANDIDERFGRELMAKQEQVDALRAKLDASILPPVDIDGARWTGEDVDKPFAPGGVIAIAFDKDQVLREIAYAWPRDGWFIVDQYDTHYPADKCRHVAPEPPDSQERIDADAEKSYCEYFGRQGKGCTGCEADTYNTRICRDAQTLDLLRRQRELDGAGDQA